VDSAVENEGGYAGETDFGSQALVVAHGVDELIAGKHLIDTIDADLVSERAQSIVIADHESLAEIGAKQPFEHRLLKPVGRRERDDSVGVESVSGPCVNE